MNSEPVSGRCVIQLERVAIGRFSVMQINDLSRVFFTQVKNLKEECI